MSDPFELLDAGQAREFLKRFPSHLRWRGEKRFRAGLVADLTPEDAGVAYKALVRDGDE